MLHLTSINADFRSTISGRDSRSGLSLTTREEVAKRASNDDIRERGANERHVCRQLGEIKYTTSRRGNWRRGLTGACDKRTKVSSLNLWHV